VWLALVNRIIGAEEKSQQKKTIIVNSILLNLNDREKIGVV